MPAVDEPAPLAEGDRLLEGGERASRPLEWVAGDREVVLQDGGFSACALLDEQGERPLHLGEPVRVTQEARARPRKPSARAGTGRPSGSASASARSAAAIASP